MQPGNAYVVNEVVDGAYRRGLSDQFPPARETPPRSSWSPSIMWRWLRKRGGLAESYQAVLVDMEAATVARFARSQGIPFYCLKAVSDTAPKSLPDFSRYTDTQGQLQLAALLAHVAIRPRYWPGLARIGKNGTKGALRDGRGAGPADG